MSYSIKDFNPGTRYGVVGIQGFGVLLLSFIGKNNLVYL